MFAGIVEWCMASGYNEIATATDVRFERILKRAGWPMDRLGDPTMINETRSVAGILPADTASFHRLRPDGYHSAITALRQKAA
jgi:acyl homoserine lactone synthase